MSVVLLISWLIVNYALAGALVYRAQRAEGAGVRPALRRAATWPAALFGRAMA